MLQCYHKAENKASIRNTPAKYGHVSIVIVSMWACLAVNVEHHCTVQPQRAGSVMFSALSTTKLVNLRDRYLCICRNKKQYWGDKIKGNEQQCIFVIWGNLSSEKCTPQNIEKYSIFITML